MSEVIHSFLDFAFKEYGIDFPSNIDANGKQHRYKMEGDKGASKSGFVTFYMDDNPTAVFGHWKKYGSDTFKWHYRNQSDLTKAEREESARKMRERSAANKEADIKRKQAAAVKAGQLWSLPDIGDINYQYLKVKGVKGHGVKFYDNKVAFEFFASDERKEKLANGEIEVFAGAVMVVPVQNANNQLVSLQQVSANGKFKGFLPDGTKKGCFHVIHGNNSVVFVAEGYATGATIFELTGCTTYIAFDCGNLDSVCDVVIDRHPDSKKVIASDDDRFTFEPIENPGQTKANSIAAKSAFINAKPEFEDWDKGTDWNDLSNTAGRDYTRDLLRLLISP